MLWWSLKEYRHRQTENQDNTVSETLVAQYYVRVFVDVNLRYHRLAILSAILSDILIQQMVYSVCMCETEGEYRISIK